MPKTKKYQRISYAVWEITLKCNLACNHCGSRAGDARTDELSTQEALSMVRQLADVGIKEITLIGGEAYLRPDWLEIAKAITDAGIRCGVTTGGYSITRKMAKQMKKAKITSVSVSLDGLEATHDRLRGRENSWQSALRTMKYIKEAGISLSCNTQINRLSAPEFPRIYETIRDAGVKAWQLQLTVPMGNAADNAEILMQPFELLELYPMLMKVVDRARQEGMQVFPGNNIGYYGPYERKLRGNGHELGFWRGCQAGLNTLGIEADGKIKGCPSLPTLSYTGGNIRDLSLHEIVESSEELRFNLKEGTSQGTEHMWGFCKSCEYAELCRGGCTWTAHVFFDRPGNNPYCHHRALAQAKKGLRERTYLKSAASGNPFDNGEFALIEEPINKPWIENDPLHFTSDKIQWSDSWQENSKILTSLAK